MAKVNLYGVKDSVIRIKVRRMITRPHNQNETLTKRNPFKGNFMCHLIFQF